MINKLDIHWLIKSQEKKCHGYKNKRNRKGTKKQRINRLTYENEKKNESENENEIENIGEYELISLSTDQKISYPQF